MKKTVIDTEIYKKSFLVEYFEYEYKQNIIR